MPPQVEGTNHVSIIGAESSRSAPTRRCFPSEDWRVSWAPTFAPKVGAFSFQCLSRWATTSEASIRIFEHRSMS